MLMLSDSNKLTLTTNSYSFKVYIPACNQYRTQIKVYSKD